MGPSFLPMAAIAHSTISVSTLGNRSLNGDGKDGSTRMTRADGFSGTVVTIWVAVCRTRTDVRSNVGKPSAGTLHTVERTVSRVIRFAVPDNGRRCCSGPTIAVVSEVSLRFSTSSQGPLCADSVEKLPDLVNSGSTMRFAKREAREFGAV